MAVAVYPLDAISSVPLYTGRMLRDTLAAILGGATSTRPLGIRSGLRPNTPTDCITMSGLNWTAVKSFAGAVDVQTAAEAGPYLFAITGSPTGTIAAQDATNPRKDILTLLVSDNAEDSTGVASGTLVYTQGVASATPAQPATPARSFLIGVFNVQKSGTGSPTFTLTTAVLSAAGGIVKTSSVSDYPASPVVGDYVDDASLGLLRWNGTTWVPQAPQSNRAELKYTGAGISCTSGANVVVSYDGTDYYNNLSAFTYNRATGTLVCTRAGTYEFDADIVWAVTGSTTGIRQLGLYKALAATPTTFVLQSVLTLPAQNTIFKMNAKWKLTLAVGDVVEFQAAQNSGGALNVAAANLGVTQIV